MASYKGADLLIIKDRRPWLAPNEHGSLGCQVLAAH